MNKSELEHIAAAYYEEIYLFCLRKVNYDEHLARDLVQDVFFIAAGTPRRPDKYEFTSVVIFCSG